MAAGTASAGLLPSLPGTPTVPGVSTPTVSTPILPSDPTGVTGAVGGVVGSAGGTVSGAIDGVLGSAPGSSGGSLSGDTLTDVLGSLLGGGSGSGGTTGGGTTSSGGSTGSGTGSSGGTAGTGSSGGSGSAGSVVSGPAYGAADSNDRTAPKLKFTVLSKLRTAARTKKLRVRVHSSEPAVVAFTTLVRPGRARWVHDRPLKVSRKLIHIKSVVLAFRRAGNVTLVLKVPAKAAKNLARTRDARFAFQTWASDLAHNQARRDVRRTVRR